MGLTTKEISSSSFNDMISSVDRRSEYVENRAGANVRLNNFLTPYTLDDKSSILNAPCGYSNGVYPSLRPVKTFGPELVTNGTFDTDLSGWQITNSDATHTVTHTSDGARFQSDTTTPIMFFETIDIILQGGKKYSLTVEIVNRNSGELKIQGNNINLFYTDNGVFTDVIEPTSDSRISFYRNSTNVDITIKSVSVKEIQEADFDFSRGSSATRVNEQGLIQDVQILSGELVQNGDFEQIGSEWFDANNVNNVNDGENTINANGTITTELNNSNIGWAIDAASILNQNKIYKVEWEIISTTSSTGNFVAWNGVDVFSFGNITQVGSGVYYIKGNSSGSSADIRFNAAENNSTITWSLSVKEVGQNWTFQDGWSMGDGKAVVTNAQSLYQRLSQSSLSFTLNSTYEISITCSEYSSGYIYLRKPRGTEPDTNLRIDSVGTFVFTFKALTELNEFALSIGSLGTDLSISNISVIEVTNDTDLPRIDYTDGTGSLLLEPQSTNLIPYSEDFTQWTAGSNTSVTFESDVVAPDGSLGVYRLQNPQTSSTFLTLGFINCRNFSLFVKAVTKGVSNQFNLDASGQPTDTKTATTQWQRFNRDFGSQANYNLGINNGIDNYASDIYIWGAQAEAESYATSYIPTNGSTVTRNADACSNAGSSDLINSTEGVLYAEISALANDGSLRLMQLSDGTNNNRVSLYYDVSSNTIYSNIVVGGSSNPLLYNANILEYLKVAVKWKENDFALWVNGIKVDTDTIGSTFTPNTLNDLSFNLNGVFDLYGRVRSVAVFKEALTDEELAKITSVTQQEAFYEMRDKMLQIDADYYEFEDYTTRLKKLF